MKTSDIADALGVHVNTGVSMKKQAFAANSMRREQLSPVQRLTSPTCKACALNLALALSWRQRAKLLAFYGMPPMVISAQRLH
jgi:hypothetical protein